MARLRLRKLHPLRAELRAFHHRLDEDHAFDAVFDRREIEILRLRFAFYLRADRAIGVEINVSEGFQISLRMARGNARKLAETRREITVAPTPSLTRLVGKLHDEFVREFLSPFEPGLCAVHAD